MSKKASGVEFPLDEKNERSTTEVNREAFATSAAIVDPAAAKRIREEKKWRSRYAKYVVEHVELGCKSEKAALAMAHEGLKYLHTTMEFVRGDESLPLYKAMEKYTDKKFFTAKIKGTKPKPSKFELEVPYKDGVLRGEALLAQIDRWTRLGVIEMTTGVALTKVVTTGKWLDLSDKYFVMLGASSAMGPYNLLMSLGANVIGVDLDRASIWKGLISTARQSCGTLIFPTKVEAKSGDSDEKLAEIAGCNLLTETPEIRTWLLNVEPEKPIIVGSYAYLDGALFVKVSMAMDAIVNELLRQRESDVSLAYLCTPSDAHVVPAAANQHSLDNLRRAPLWQKLAGPVISLFGPKACVKNARKPVEGENGERYYVMDCIVNDQGPNYILAKRLQHWRAVLARHSVHKNDESAPGAIVSTNIAPSTSTVSVVHNRMFALAYKGMHNFKPMEVFDQKTSQAVMGSLLIHDIQNPYSVANPTIKLSNPLSLFSENSFHGGAWRTAYKFGSIGAPSVLSAIVTNYFVKAYLCMYNAVQAGGWTWAFLMCLMTLINSPNSSPWASAGYFISTFQWLSIAEIFHAAIGLVRSPVPTTAMQIFSRLLLVCAVEYVKPLQDGSNYFLWAMCLAWCLTETIRYPFYCLGILGKNVKILTWLRYTLFLILYPMGVTGEMGCLYLGQKQLAAATADAPLLVRYPLQPLLSCPCGYWLFIAPMYAIGFSTLYSYMLQQRKKVLGGSRKKKQE